MGRMLSFVGLFSFKKCFFVVASDLVLDMTDVVVENSNKYSLLVFI